MKTTDKIYQNVLEINSLSLQVIAWINEIRAMQDKISVIPIQRHIKENKKETDTEPLTTQHNVSYIDDNSHDIDNIRENLKIIKFPEFSTQQQDKTENIDIRSLEKEIETMLKGTKGSLRIRKDGRLEYRYCQNGKQYSVYGKTKTQLMQRLRESRNQLKKETENPHKKKNLYITFYDFYEQWKSLYKKGKIKEQSIYQADRKIQKYIIPTFGKYLLKDIHPENMQALFNTIKSARTEKYLYSILHQIFEKAIDLKHIERSPLNGLIRTKYVAKESTYLNDEEIAILLRESSPKYKELFKFYLLTGCRRNEALSIKSSDVNLKDGILHIPGTKTRSSDRYLHIGDELRELLEKIINRDVLFVFCPEEITRTFHKILPNHHLHELRHTFATKCLAAGVEMKVIQLWLGHSSAQTTANIYAKVSKELLAKSISQLPKFLP